MFLDKLCHGLYKKYCILLIYPKTRKQVGPHFPNVKISSASMIASAASTRNIPGSGTNQHHPNSSFDLYIFTCPTIHIRRFTFLFFR